MLLGSFGRSFSFFLSFFLFVVGRQAVVMGKDANGKTMEYNGEEKSVSRIPQGEITSRTMAQNWQHA